MKKIKNINPKRLRTIGTGIGAALLATVVLGGGARPAETVSQQGLNESSELGRAGGIRMVAVEGEGVEYWPRWRGPSGQGLVDGSGYPDTWSDFENIL